MTAAHIWDVVMEAWDPQQELWCLRGDILEIDQCGFWLTLPLAFRDGEEDRCPAMCGRVASWEELSHVPSDFQMFPRLNSLTFTNVNQQYLEHNNPENKF